MFAEDAWQLLTQVSGCQEEVITLPEKQKKEDMKIEQNNTKN